jgi:UDP-N-acetylmuramoyl-L-alanyl-D-glutamate--2,6-diaminopimelate ligase
MASAFYGAQPATMVAVTGTNGKTSTADFARQIWIGLGHKAASIGTLGIVAPGWDNKGGLTTPDPETLHANLKALADMGVDHACIEASSHGLSQYRLDGVAIKAAAFTNLTRDHLDYHGDMASYGQAKQRLFSELLPDDGVAVINADQPQSSDFIAIAQRRGLKVLTFGQKGTDIRLISAEPLSHGQKLSLDMFGTRCQVLLPLAGTFQAWNALAALGLVIATGADAQSALAQLATLNGVPGRLQMIAHRQSGASIYVDYAHTPDALETVLTALRPHVADGARLVCLFGCGGDRDPGKRPQMGAIAEKLADIVFVSDDNPRSEDPALIRQAILAATPSATEIADRGQAIRTAVGTLKAGDVLVLAGKGHERGQIVGKSVLPFDDAEEAQKAVAEIEGGAV